MSANWHFRLMIFLSKDPHRSWLAGWGRRSLPVLINVAGIFWQSITDKVKSAIGQRRFGVVGL
jgi:hypothetical protein